MINKDRYNLGTTMTELEMLGREQTKKTYIRHGAHEPLFGVNIGPLKTLAKKVGKSYQLALELYDTGNYDAMYFAGMITEPEKMTKEDLEHWIQEAYCSGLSESVVAITLAESNYGKELAEKWIKSDEERYAAAGWACYAALLGYESDDDFDKEKIQQYLIDIKTSLHSAKNRVRYAMNNFVITVGISYLPLANEALEIAKDIGEVTVDMGDTSCKTPLARDYIESALNKNRQGYKRKNVRC